MPGNPAAVLVPALLVVGVDATRHDGFHGLVLADLLRRSDHVVGRGDLARPIPDPNTPPPRPTT